jgi:hypothetical protein
MARFLPRLLFYSLERGQSGALSFVLCIIIIIWAVCVVLLCKFLYLLFDAPKKSVDAGALALNWLIGLFAGLFGLQIILLIIKQNINGFIPAPTYIGLFILGIAIFMKKKLFKEFSDAIWYESNSSPKDMMKKEKIKPKKKCDVCHHIYLEALVSCPKCGYRDASLWVCSHCQTHNDPRRTNCKNCGIDKVKTDKEPIADMPENRKTDKKKNYNPLIGVLLSLSVM